MTSEVISCLIALKGCLAQVILLNVSAWSFTQGCLFSLLFKPKKDSFIIIEISVYVLGN